MPKNSITLVKRTAGGIAYWDARWHDHAAGKRRSKTLGRCDGVSDRQARKLLAQLEIKFEDDPRSRSPQSVPALGEWLELLIQRKEAAGRKPKTLSDYHLLKRFLLAHFGAQRQLGTITKFDLEQFRLRLSRHELHKPTNAGDGRRPSAVSIVKYMRMLRSAVFMAAFDDELIPRNPARKLGLAQTPAASWRKVGGEEFWKLHAQAGGGVKTLLALCRLAGLRHSDAMALRWTNVRFDEGVLVFRPIKVERFAKVDARVPICAELRKILEDARQAGFRIDGQVVAPEAAYEIYRDFAKLCTAAGIEAWCKPLHTLRKSCIDDWARIAPPNVVMEWATHTSLATTMKYYSKVHKSDETIGQGNLFKSTVRRSRLRGWLKTV